MIGTEEIALRVPGRHLCGLTSLGGLLWYSDHGLDEIIAVDPETGAVVSRFPCPGVRTGLTAADGGRCLMQVVGGDKRLRAIDPRSGETLAEYPNPRRGGELCGIQDTPAGLWTGYSDPSVIDLRRLSDPEPLMSFPVHENVADLTVVDHLVVFANHLNARINVLDPTVGSIVRTIPVGGNPTGLTWDGQRLWYCDYGTSHLRALDFSPADVGMLA
jgi:DNA-binding beta-propeller fold protein YncE